MNNKRLNSIATVASYALGLTLAPWVNIWLFGGYGGRGMGVIILGIIIGSIIRFVILREKGEQDAADISVQSHVMPQEIHEEKISSEPVDVGTSNEFFVSQEPEMESIHEKKAYIEKSEPKKAIFRSKKIRPNPIKQFFAENTLAKIGGILIFLAVVALLSVVYNRIGAVGRISLSFLCGVLIYVAGVHLHKKDHKPEGNICMGVGILIFYLVVYFAQFVSQFQFPSLWVVILLLLALVCAFGVLTGMMYRSKLLIGFSMLVAYVNPFLTGGPTPLDPWNIVMYVCVLCVGALILSSFFWSKEESQNNILAHWLFFMSFIASIILILLAPQTQDIHWVIKLVTFFVLFLAYVFTAYRSNKTSLLPYIITGGYITYTLLLMIDSPTSQMGVGYIMSIGVLIVMMLVSFVYLFVTTLPYAIVLIGAPFLIVGGCLFFDIFYLPIFTIIIIFFSYLLFTTFYALKKQDNLIIWLGIIGSLFLIVSIFSFVDLEQSITMQQASWLIGASTLSYCVHLLIALKKNIFELWSLSGIGNSTLFILSFYLVGPDVFSTGILLFGIVSVFLISYLPSFYLQKSSNLDPFCIMNIILGAVFVLGFTVYLGSIRQPWGILLGFVLLLIAALYFFGAFIFFQRDMRSENETSTQSYMSIFLAICVLFVTVSFVYLFENRNALVLSWLLEGTLFFYIWNRFQYALIGLSASVVSIVGLITFVVDAPKVFENPWIFVFVAVIAFMNHILLRGKHGLVLHVHDFVYALGTIAWSILFVVSMKSGESEHIFFQLFLMMTYCATMLSGRRFMFIFYLLFFSITQMTWFEQISDWSGLWLLAISVAWIGMMYVGYKYLYQGVKSLLPGLFGVIWIFVHSSYWLLYRFDNQYILTFYWILWFVGLLLIGMMTKKGVYRTAFLYVYILTLLKIVVIDLKQIFVENDQNGIFIGIGVLLLIGVISIAMSSVYRKVFGENALAKDLRFGFITDK